MFCHRSSTWRRPRRPPAITNAADALELVAMTMSRPPRAETIAFLLDDDGFGTTVLLVNGTDRPEDVIGVVEQVAEAGAVSGASALFVASVRPVAPSPDEAIEVAEGDIDRWLEASELADDEGLELLEWFVVGPAGVICPRELLGEPPRWPCST